MSKYKITPGLKGYRVWEIRESGGWDQLTIDFPTWEDAEEGMRRIASTEARHYDEGGKPIPKED